MKYRADKLHDNYGLPPLPMRKAALAVTGISIIAH